MIDLWNSLDPRTLAIILFVMGAAINLVIWYAVLVVAHEDDWDDDEEVDE